MDYTKLALPELANAIIQTERAIRQCKEILVCVLKTSSV